ncbi:hypothetical protein DRW07_15275 [Alteromonas sediminis]|uniref:DUF4097 domain-containing protein n=1 Tax=Alteromonas sediminis TaxID=2259342 RepID=A0A3N5Z8E8_9ALTE|nr:DUF4097 family beta strand repeat-containing protein [Alteromonas sediminis]RPJ65268.1 hypothetical protein DRW07_15275 [Alteromonas sediminis]
MKNVIISLSMVGLALSSSAAFAQQAVNESMSASANGYVHIEHMNGKAKIIGWDKNEVTVTGEVGEKTEEFIFEKRGDEIRIEVEVKSKGWGGWGNWSSDEGDDLTIYVPSASSINYESINARVSLEQLSGGIQVEVVNGHVDADTISGRMRFESVNGNIDVENVEGDLSVETVNGDIRGEQSGNGDLNLDTVNGNIRFTSQSEDVRAESVNGGIELKLATVRDLDITTVNGGIEVGMMLHKEGDVQASSVGGRIEMTFQKDVNARFDIEGHAGGKIVNRITSDEMQKAKYGPRRWLNFSTGSGSAQVEISTVNGRVELSTD